ncbi:hypothetical protein GCM10010151_62490 [Actinoallomurus spadix]|uniref:Uncharacterized protein n=1 Tax=Actinoallomurus spadix TaxID=79912 RepID=A0ABN0XHL1_9ACTN
MIRRCAAEAGGLAVLSYAAVRTPGDPQPASTMPGIGASAPTSAASSLDRLRPLKDATSAKLRRRSPAITR